MIQYHIFPGGKRRALTFSYDDGSEGDIRLVELFNRYGVKGSFHLNAGRFIGADDGTLIALRERYRGHEISCHTVQHGWPARMPSVSLLREVLEDRAFLERVAGCPVVGMSYPSGSYSAEVINTLRAAGIVYSRTTRSTGSFPLPDDFLAWHPSCHHRDAMALADKFLEDLDSQWRQPLFYIWGHAHELRTEEDWAYMEALVARLAGNDKIWYATNLEIYEYMTAQRALRISVDETVFYNPTAIDVWVERDKREVFCIPAGQTVRREKI